MRDDKNLRGNGDELWLSGLFLSEDGAIVLFDQFGMKYQLIGFDETDCICKRA